MWVQSQSNWVIIDSSHSNKMEKEEKPPPHTKWGAPPMLNSGLLKKPHTNYSMAVVWSSSQIRSPTWSQSCCIMTLHLFHSKVEVTIVSTRSIRKRCLSNIMFCTFCVFGNTFKYTCESSAKYGLDPIISSQLFFSFLAKITQGMVLLMHLMCNTKYISQTIPLHKCALNPKIGFVIYLVVFFYNCIWVQLKLDFGFWNL